MILALLLAVLHPRTGRCSPQQYLNGVHRDGTYVCRSRPPRAEPPQERRGVIVDDHARETRGRVWCADAERAVVTERGEVECRR